MADLEFAGETFRMSDSIGLMPLMKFAKVAKAGVDSDDLDGLAALYDLLEQCVAEEDWERFQAAATKSRADGEKLMGVVSDVFEALSKRPTGRPSDSSDGPTPMHQNSEAVSSLRVVAREEAAGRPDRALMVLLAHEAQTA